jgi:hypothetical protein
MPRLQRLISESLHVIREARARYRRLAGIPGPSRLKALLRTGCPLDLRTRLAPLLVVEASAGLLLAWRQLFARPPASADLGRLRSPQPS